MAERRMFAKTIIGSARFLRMPPSSRLLYYDLGMYADDDGIVEAFSVMRQTGATEDDLRVLVSKGFVKVLNDDLVSYIMDWNINNTIRKDRYHPCIYKDLVLQLTDGIPSDNQVTTNGIPRLGKDSIDKDSIDKKGRFTPPTLSEVQAYVNEKGYHIDAESFIDFYASKGWMVGKNKMKDWKAAVRTWEKRRKDEQRMGQVHNGTTDRNGRGVAGTAYGSGSGTEAGKVTFPRANFGFEEEE